MKFDSILDELRNNRLENEKIKDDTFDIIKDSLDKTEDVKDNIRDSINNNLEIVPFNKNGIDLHSGKFKRY